MTTKAIPNSLRRIGRLLRFVTLRRMVAPTVAARMDQAIREYIRACNAGDAQKIATYLHADAIHYYPNHPKFAAASAIAARVAKRVRENGVWWTVDQITVDGDRCIGVLEFTLFAGKDLILRGLEL
jgi:ketosteroid isomerase-like protein